MCLFKRKKKNKKKEKKYIRNDLKQELDRDSKEEFPVYCMALTKKGTRCKNKAVKGSPFCYIHNAMYK